MVEISSMEARVQSKTWQSSQKVVVTMTMPFMNMAIKLSITFKVRYFS
jgi:hypothetical protein